MIGGHDQRGRTEHLPVAVEGQKRQRAEDVKVCFDASTGQMDEQRRGEHHTVRRLCASGSPTLPQRGWIARGNPERHVCPPSGDRLRHRNLASSGPDRSTNHRMPRRHDKCRRHEWLMYEAWRCVGGLSKRLIADLSHSPCGCAGVAGQAAFLLAFFAALFFFAVRALLLAAGFFGVVGEVVVALAFFGAAARSCDTAGRASSSAAAAVATP